MAEPGNELGRGQDLGIYFRGWKWEEKKIQKKKKNKKTKIAYIA